ncbi:Fatty acid hydroxylase [Mycena sanguinolenta]|uniref:Fatty acid hydroxylase n=1 Tax=Mycena sanguinolenta TaxID=230812 RepID=A0A8H6XSQ3_9AGAR|nr:Fatty acid hydroxylase [Mycena sanguinolenta]
MSIPIPQPSTIPFIGNVTSVEREVPLRSFRLLARTYGGIYQLNMLGQKLIFVSSYDLVNEVSDDTRFNKRVAGPLREVRNLVGDALFTAESNEPNWGIAHRLLMPAFGTLAVKDMLEEMRDISNQLLLKWERPNALIDPSDDFTRVALDTIAYCSMSHRLNSFYTEQQPEFAVAMGDFLRESGARFTRPRVVQALMQGATAKYKADMKTMKDLADQIVATRKAHPTPKHDLLDIMLNSRDPKTGQAMTEQSIAENLLTFLIAGHETSSGMMSFMVYFLLKNPEKMRKLRAEIDEVLGDRPIQYDDFAKLPYLIAVMRETLRLAATAPIRQTAALKDTTIGGGKYAVKKGAPILVISWELHRDPAVWGDDAEEFRPERMLDGKFEALPPNAWQPFGFGFRACIGRAFAWQEVCLVMASVIQRFDLSFADPSYTLELKQTLTIKPKDLYIRASLRSGAVQLLATPSSALMASRSNNAGQTSSGSRMSTGKTSSSDGLPLYVLYGSNTGTSEAFAQRIASEAPSYGFRSSIGTLDSALGKVPKDGPVVIITSSFEGEPPDNAAQFIDWLRNIKNGNEFDNVRFAVFGCGNSDWKATFQKIPTLCDELLEKHGGRRLIERGSGDASAGDFFQKFDEFEAGLWATLSKEYSTSRSESLAQTLDVKMVDIGTDRATALRQADAFLGRVIENRILTKNGPVKRHIEFELPEGSTAARAGDYVSILPQNPLRDVQRVLAHFGLSNEAEVVLSSVGPTSLPVGKQVKLSEVLSGYVEISQPATTRDLAKLSDAATSTATRAYIDELKANYKDAVQSTRLSVFEILESRTDIHTLHRCLPTNAPSNARPAILNLVFASLEPDAYHHHIQRPGPTLLIQKNDQLLPRRRLQLPRQPNPRRPRTDDRPLLCGSVPPPGKSHDASRHERAVQKASGRQVAEMLLFFGCRSPEVDFLYSDKELAEWSREGVVDVRPAFSRSPEDSEGCKYVQHRVRRDSADIVNALNNGASFFTCGSAAVAKGIKTTLVEIIMEEENLQFSEAMDKFERIMKGRYATDVFE